MREHVARAVPFLAAALVAAAVLLCALLAGPVAGAARAQPPTGGNFTQDTTTDDSFTQDTPAGGPSGETTTDDSFTQNAPTEDPSSTQDDTSGGFFTQDTPTTADPSGETFTAGSLTGDSSGDIYGEGQEDPGGLTGMVLDWFLAIMGFVYDSTIGDLLTKVAEALQAGILGLPSPSGQVAEMYDGMVGAFRPVILVGILVTALLMMLRTSNYDVAYAGFSALPKWLGVGVAFAFLPQFMQILSNLTLEVSDAFLPSADRAALAEVELFKAAITNLNGAGFLNILFAAAYVWFGAQVVLVAIVKNILYQLLFIASPLALVASMIPGVSHLTGSWFRGVLACAAIPVLWSLELGIATVIVASPEVIFGEMVNVLADWSNGIFTTLGAILMLWLMKKTPFKVLEWAFESYDASQGAWRGLVRGVVGSLAIGGVHRGLSALANRGGQTATSGGLGGGSSAGTNKGGLGRNSLASRKTGKMSESQPTRGGSDGTSPGGSSAKGSSATGASATALSGRDSSRTAVGSGQGSAGQIGAGGQQRGALAAGSEQKALPPPSPAIQRYIAQEGTTPGMGRPEGTNIGARKAQMNRRQ